MATIVQDRKPVTVDPLRHSAPLGAVLAFLRSCRCMSLLSSQGCAALVKVLLTRHFRESIPLQTSALTEVTTILGSGDSLLAGIATVADRLQPDLVGVITTGLVDAAGEDVRRTLALRPPGTPVVLATVPDLGGGLDQGYAAAVEALVAELVLPGAGPPGSDRRQVTLVPGQHSVRWTWRSCASTPKPSGCGPSSCPIPLAPWTATLTMTGRPC